MMRIQIGVLVLPLLCSACGITGLLDSPPVYVHELTYELDGAQHTVRHTIPCVANQTVFSAATGRFERHSVPWVSTDNAASYLPNGWMLVYQLDAPCGRLENDYSHFVRLVTNSTDIDSVYWFRRVSKANDSDGVKVDGHDFKLLKSSSERLAEGLDSSPSPVEMAPPDVLAKLQQTFESPVAYYYSENRWRDSPDLVDAFAKLKGVTRLDDAFSQSINGSTPLAEQLKFPETHVLSYDGERYVWGASSAPASFKYRHGARRASQFVYKGKAWPLDNETYLYDADSRQVIRVRMQSQRLR